MVFCETLGVKVKLCETFRGQSVIMQKFLGSKCNYVKTFGVKKWLCASSEAKIWLSESFGCEFHILGENKRVELG